jgi:Fic family protein
MKIDMFSKNAAGKVIKGLDGEAAYHAFVPGELPPSIKMGMPLVRSLSEADRALGELAGLGRTLSNPRLLINPFMRQEAVLSSRIEGTQAGLEDLYGYEADQLYLPGVKPPESDVKEVFNYVVALEYGIARMKDLPISLRLIREIHERLMEGVRGDRATPGEFRRSQNWIGPAGCSLNKATFVPPPVHEMKGALGAFETYLHAEDDLPPLVRLALIHYQFEAIHPFIDGNGRVGRLLIPLLMVNWALLPHPLLYLSVYFERHRDEYYAHLLKVSTEGTWEAWVAFFLTGVATQARDAVARAKKLQDLHVRWVAALHTEGASPLTLRLVDSLFDRPILTIPAAQGFLGASYPGAKKAVEKLLAIGAIQEVTGKSRGKKYIAGEVLKIIMDDVTLF